MVLSGSEVVTECVVRLVVDGEVRCGLSGPGLQVEEDDWCEPASEAVQGGP